MSVCECARVCVWNRNSEAALVGRTITASKHASGRTDTSRRGPFNVDTGRENGVGLARRLAVEMPSFHQFQPFTAWP